MFLESRNMKLRDYLYFERIAIKDFAKKINYAPSHIGEYMSGRNRLSRKAADLIEKATDGKVTAKEILDANPPKKIMNQEDSNGE